MTITAGDVLRAAVEFTMPEQVDAFNILGLKVLTGSCTDAELLAAVGGWLTGAFSWLEAGISDQVDIANCRVTKMAWVATQWEVSAVIGNVIPTFTAEAVDDMLPHAVSSVITLPTGKPTSRGRINIPGATESVQADSVIAGLWATALASFATGIMTQLSPGTTTIDYAVLGNDGQARVPTGANVNGILGSQRRRKPGVGI